MHCLALPRWWPPSLARPVYEPSSASVPRLSRFPLGFQNMASGSREEAEGDDPGKPDTRLNITSANEHSSGIQAGMNNMETRSTTSEFIACYGEVTDAGRQEGTAITDGKVYERLDALKARYPFDGVFPLDEFPKSRHRDGSIYKCRHSWTRKRFTDRSESGTLINVGGLKRGIDFLGDVLIEYDMKIKTAEPEKHDLQLIDGVSVQGNMGMRNRIVFTRRVHGDCGAVDITYSNLENAVEATVEVTISEVQSSFNLSLGCFTSGLNEQILLFDGVIGEARNLKRSVVAVEIDSWIHLKFKVGMERSSSAERDCFFNAGNHGSSARKIKTDFALMSVKVIWSPLPEGF